LYTYCVNVAAMFDVFQGDWGWWVAGCSYLSVFKIRTFTKVAFGLAQKARGTFVARWTKARTWCQCTRVEQLAMFDISKDDWGWVVDCSDLSMFKPETFTKVASGPAQKHDIEFNVEQIHVASNV
jgi:hypothetical protein